MPKIDLTVSVPLSIIVTNWISADYECSRNTLK